MNINNLRVAQKLWLVIMGLLTLILVVGVWGQIAVRSATDRAAQVVAHYESSITTAVRWQGLAELATAMTLSRAKVTDAALRADFEARSIELSKRISPVQEEISKTARSERDKAVLAEIAKLRVTVLANRDQMKKFEEAQDQAGLLAFVESQYRPTQSIYLATIGKYITEQQAQRDEARAELEAQHQRLLMISGVGVLVVLALSVGLIRWLVLSITKPLDSAVSVAQAIAQGDLTQSLKTRRKDEFGLLLQALADMNERLRQLVSKVRAGVESVSNASDEIASGNQDLSARTEQTAANLEETAASIEQLTSTVAQSADTARQANQLVTSAAGSAARGGEVMDQVVQSMQQISESSKKINDIISVIDGIAFQTNILALNAAVEAARAGEQGRGFAVVASEVRSLAGRSADAAKEIKTLIGASVATVATGSTQVEQAGMAMDEIVTNVKRVSDLIGEITSSAEEQRDGIKQVNQAITTLDQMTQQNASLVEESAAAASGLRDQALRLAQVVAVFNVGTGVPMAAQIAARPLASSAAPAPAPALSAQPKPAASRPAATPPRLTSTLASASKPKPVTANGKGDDGDWGVF
ncbi:chemotaxis protein [Hylemonella gracilis str. Niagara R]|uniref:Chemotaxis protein n=1 Tax=Hylemonella gracilis str. Niagara R TaxID=1458275 RepID=A0A016XK58_9BURK|nr:methyl-accepting chemotaxis protein [Hylemonella gracilis]EYC52236.1 chemotaxis protein [Hylemonella gracilis str. Niagara R]